MPAFAASAPGKVILFGEHAAVYARPALAAPLNEVRARAAVIPDPTAPSGRVWIDAPDIALHAALSDLPDEHPLAQPILAVQRALGLGHLPAMRLRVTSEIPIASGLGSGAAISTAIARAVSGFLGRPLSDEQVSGIAYDVDRTYHGTPSGVDNTVIAYAQPVFFIRGQPFVRLHVAAPFSLLVADTGVRASTAAVVNDVRRRYDTAPDRFEPLFDAIAEIVLQARAAIESGAPAALGALMTRNHALLQTLEVSSPELDRLVEAALRAGAGGAKLSGAGRGGNCIALVESRAAAEPVEAALREAGARRVLFTSLS